jgi:hypothetical protein
MINVTMTVLAMRMPCHVSTRRVGRIHGSCIASDERIEAYLGANILLTDADDIDRITVRFLLR